eukprot:1491298-Rhodomonas_salina.1
MAWTAAAPGGAATRDMPAGHGGPTVTGSAAVTASGHESPQSVETGNLIPGPGQLIQVRQPGIRT